MREGFRWRNPTKKREETNREGRREREERMRRKGEKKRERNEDRQLHPLIYRRSNCRSLLDRELKPFYSMKAMLQEVGILLPLVSFALRGCLSEFLACDKAALF